MGLKPKGKGRCESKAISPELLEQAILLLGKAGHLIAGLIPYQSIDPFDSFAEISIHHAVELLIALALIELMF